MHVPDFDPVIYQKRRQRLVETLGPGLVIVPTAPERLRNRDTHWPYRFDSTFWYLCGFPEPEAVLIIDARPGQPVVTRLLCRDKNPEREVWDGFRWGPQAARERFGVDETCSIAELDEKLPEWIADQPTVWHSLGMDSAWDERLIRALNHVRSQARQGILPPGAIGDWQRAVDRQRLIKDEHEIACLRRAAAIADQAHARAMQALRPGLREYEIEAELLHAFRRQGAVPSFPPIVAGGSNACTLHYTGNDDELCAGQLVLIDAGCEVEGYASDITRTTPVSGRFSAVQRDVYQLVLAAQQAALAATAPGVPFDGPHEAAVRVLAQGLLDFGLLQGALDQVLEQKTYQRFYMHRTGHWLGLDVHDAGPYRQGDVSTPLLPGMTLTIEPGLYIAAADDIPAAYRGIGIRIEDDVIVTAEGADYLTHAPRQVAAIEEWIENGR